MIDFPVYTSRCFGKVNARDVPAGDQQKMVCDRRPEKIGSKHEACGLSPNPSSNKLPIERLV